MSNSIDPNNPLPLYYQVYADIRQRIESGELNPGDALPPERKLVAEYGVSRITIVKAMDKLVSDDLIERQHGRGTFVKEPPQAEAEEVRVIGFLPGGILHPYHYSIQLGIAQETAQSQYYLQVFGLDEEARTRSEDILRLITDRVHGLVVYPLPDKKDMRLYRRLLEMNISLVMVDRRYEEIEADYVGYNSEQAGYDLTRFFLERGHERIAILPHHEINASSIRDRVAGYRRAMNEVGISDTEDLIWLDVYAKYRPTLSQKKGDPAMTETLHQRLEDQKPTALIAINHDVAERLTFDLMTINAERARLAIAHNSSPNYELDVEIATFGVNSPEDYGPYTVAVAYQPGEIIGREAARILIGRLRGDFQGSPRRVEIPIEISVRQ